jgi:hypothetical protein
MEHTQGVTESTPRLIARYAERFDTAFADGCGRIGSPLGAWLLLALVASAAKDPERARLEDTLGTDVEDACRRVGALLACPHPAVAVAAALWWREALMFRRFGEWVERLPAEFERGPMPSQLDADAWVRRVTGRMLDRFPLELDAPSRPTAVTLASALATAVRWSEPFEVADASELRGDWAAAVARALATPSDGHVMCIADTADAGLVGVHGACSRDGLFVVSVIADPTVPQPDVQAAAHDVALGLARQGSPTVLAAPTTMTRRSLFDLPLGDSQAWTISEAAATESSTLPSERYRAVLPAWQAQTAYDLLPARHDLGFGDAARVLAALCKPESGPMAVEARQVACAGYDLIGFEAAAISVIKLAALAGPGQETLVQRRADLRFNRPYAVVAITVDHDPATHTRFPNVGDWHGVPVFSAWVEEPTEPDDHR